MKQAYVTLLSSEDYLPAVLILNRNLKEVGCKYPLYTMVTEDIYDNVISYFEKENALTIKVPVISYSKETIEKTPSKRFQSIASKLNVFRLHEFDKVVYLDADCLILRSYDELFNYPDGALYDCGLPTGFVGLFVCRPASHPLHYYLSILQHSECMWESDLLEELWFPFKTNPDYHIPFNYFITIVHNLDSMYPIDKYIYGLHFCCKFKPWLYNSYKAYLRDYDKHYCTYSPIREQLVKIYFEKYLIPFRSDYPELFNN